MSTLKQFNYLITIVHEGSFTAASEKLFIAQSALSRQIKNLEQELGFEIFDRTQKRIKLTSAGQILYQNLKNHLAHLHRSIALAQRVDRGEGRMLNVAHSSSIIMDHQKLKVLEHLCNTQHIEIEINTLSSELQIESVLNGSIDLGLIRPPIYQTLDQVNSLSLYTAPLYVAVHISNSVLYPQTHVCITELEPFDFVSTPHHERGGLSYLATNLCLSHGFAPKKAKIRSRKLSQLDLVAHGLGICIVPEEFQAVLPQDVKLIPITGESYLSEVKLIWKKDSEAIVYDCAERLQRSFNQHLLSNQNY